jgi:serine phosphatase RsbU (regulator of sigma subunit)
MSSFLVLSTLDLVLGGLVFLLGLVILRENPRQKLNRAVAFMLFFGGLGSILAAMGFLSSSPHLDEASRTLPQGILGHFSYLWEFFFPTLFLFASIFPTERAFTRKVRSFEILVFTPHIFHFVLLLGISILGSRLPTLDLNLPHFLHPILSLVGLLFEFFLAVHRSLFSLVNLGYGVAGAVLLVDSYRHARVPRLKQQLRVIGVGLILCLSLYSVASSIPTLLNLRLTEWLRSILTIAALTVGSGAIAYSMVRYKFLDTKLLARRGILYAVASAVLVGIYLGVVAQLNQFLTGFIGTDTRVFEPVFLIIALILFQPVLTRLEERLDLYFLRDPGDYRNVLKNLGRELLTSIDLDEMLSRSIRTVAEALMLRNAYVVALARGGPLVYTGSGRHPREEDLDPLPDILEHLDPAIESFRLYGPVEEMPRPDRAHLVNRFHAALVIPLRTKGETVGALLLGDKITGTEYTSEDVTLLSTLAVQMSISLQNGLLLRDRVAVARLEEELNLARRIQKSFLPSRFPPMSRLDVHAVNTPSRQVGGDFYDLVPAGDGTYFLAIADVSGKGVPAALLTSMLQASLRTQADTARSVSTILNNINSLVVKSTTTEQFATFFLARVDERTLTMSFSNAGHNYPVLYRKNGEQEHLVRGGMILGMFEGIRFEEEAMDLFPGDRLLFYTDGITEAMNAAGEEFGEERVEALLRGLPPDLTAREMTERILEGLYAFLEGEEPQDDVTVMVLRVLEPTEAPTGAEPERVSAETAGG